MQGASLPLELVSLARWHPKPRLAPARYALSRSPLVLDSRRFLDVDLFLIFFKKSSIIFDIFHQVSNLSFGATRSVKFFQDSAEILDDIFGMSEKLFWGCFTIVSRSNQREKLVPRCL